MPPRSTFVTVLSWIAIVGSGVYAVTGVVSVFVLFGVNLPESSVVAPEIQTDLGRTLSLSRAGAVAVLIFNAFFVVCGIGLFRRQEWARRSFIALLGLAAVWLVATALFVDSKLVGLQGPFMISRMFNIVWGALAVSLVWWIVRRLSTTSVRSEFAAPAT